MKFSLIISDGSHPCSTAPLQGPAEVCFEKAAKLQVQGVQLTLDSPARYPPGADPVPDGKDGARRFWPCDRRDLHKMGMQYRERK